jgi:guanine deaminase
MGGDTIVRGRVLHTPRNPFLGESALELFEDGAVAFDPDGTILATGTFSDVRRARSDARVEDTQGVFLLPGLIDTHVHFPQFAIIGAMGLQLLDWLQTRTLPEEARMADDRVARETARRFLGALAANGTTSALVFGSHFPSAQEIFFREASTSGLRITSGLVVSDRELRPDLHLTPAQALAATEALIDRWHGHGRLRYAVTPRFALSCSDAMLGACEAALGLREGLFVTSHINENAAEVEAVSRLFPWARDYLSTYERFSLVGPRSVFAHNVHAGDGELTRLAGAGASVAHCASSNAFLGSGLFPMRRHLEHGVRIALGTDIGAGTSFSMFNEGLSAYEGQRLKSDGQALGPVELLYLATRAGAQALGLDDKVGDLRPGKSADLIAIRPPRHSTLEAVLRTEPTPESQLGAIITLARETSVEQVRVAGAVVFSRDPA